jgi:DNA-binding NarL/FixJ family response regulator
LEKLEKTEGPMNLRILIAGSRSLTRSALRLLLQETKGFEVVGEAADSEELLAQIQAKHPNVVLLEWELPGQPGLELLPALLGLNSRPVLIVLSGRPELEQAVRDAGAHAFFNLGEPPKRLLATLQAIQEGATPE